MSCSVGGGRIARMRGTQERLICGGKNAHRFRPVGHAGNAAAMEYASRIPISLESALKALLSRFPTSGLPFTKHWTDIHVER